MKLEQFDWWQFADTKHVHRRFSRYVFQGVPVYEIDGREEWLMLEDGTGLFILDHKDKPVLHLSDTKEFAEMVEYLHREDWVDDVLNDMDNLWEYTLIDEFDIPDDHDTPDICDAAYEWLPYVLPKTYAKVFPSPELIRKLTIAFFIDQTDPQTINFDEENAQ